MNFKEIIKQIDTIVADPTTPVRFSRSMEAIMSILSTILVTKGVPGWHRKADPSLDLTEGDEHALQPIVDLLCHEKMAGGGGESYTIDGVVHSIKNTFKSLDERGQHFKQMLGVGSFQNSDGEEDLKLLAPMADLIGGLLPVTKPAMMYIREIPFPRRTIAFFMYTAVEVIRILWSVPGHDNPLPRQLLSLVLAIGDALKGDWKLALLSIAGMYNQSAMYAGFAMKMGLQTFRLIDPQLQDSMIFGTLSVGKSLFVGFFLQFFQIFATLDMRKKAAEILDKLTDKEKKVDESIQGADGTPREDYFTNLTFDTIQNVQAVIHEHARNCSDRFQGILASADILSSPALVIIFSILDIPITPEQFEQMCKKKGSWASKIAAEQKVGSNPVSTTVSAPPVPPVPKEAPPASATPKEATPAPAEAPAVPEVAPAEAPAEEAPPKEATAVPEAPAVPEVAPPVPDTPVPKEAPAVPEVSPAPKAAAKPAILTTGPPVTNRYTQALKKVGGLRRTRKKRITS